MLHLAPWLCWLAPLGGALLTLALSIFKDFRNKGKYVACLSSGISVIFSLAMLPQVLSGQVTDWKLSVPKPIEIGVLVDPLTVTMAIVISVISLFVVVFSSGYMQGKQSQTRFWFILQLFSAGYLLVVLADNLLLMFIGWEVVGLCVTLLASFDYTKRRKTYFGLKINTILRIGDLALLMFILTVYSFSGTFNFLELAQQNTWIIRLSESGLLLVSSLLFLVGVTSKAAQFPLNEWLPDMLVNTPSSTNALTEVLAGPYLLIRFLPLLNAAYFLGHSELGYFFLLSACIGGATGLISALIATTQKHAQRVMAYSISGIMGFTFIAFGLAGLNANLTSGYLAAVTIIIVDAFVSALLILTTVFVSHATKSEKIEEMSGFKSKVAHRGMEVAIFAMISVPPFSGFWLSNWVQTLALDFSTSTSNQGSLIPANSGYILFILMILTGCLTAFYGIKMMSLIFGKKHVRRKKALVPRSMRHSIISLLVLTASLDLIVVFLVPQLNTFFLPIVKVQIFQNFIDFSIYIIPSASTIATLIALLIGWYLSRQIYSKHKIDSQKIMETYPFIKKCYVVLLNRCYIPTAYHKIGTTAIKFSELLYRNIESEGIKRIRIKGISEFFDLFSNRLVQFSRRIFLTVEKQGFEWTNRKISIIIISLSKRIRKLQTGVLSNNLLLMSVGAVLLGLSILVISDYLGMLR